MNKPILLPSFILVTIIVLIFVPSNSFVPNVSGQHLPRVFCPTWDPYCTFTDPFPNCGINPHAPPCNLPCLSPTDPFCIGDNNRDTLMSNNTHVTIKITDSSSNETKILQGNIDSIGFQLANETSKALSTNINKAAALHQTNILLNNIVNSNQNLATPVNSQNEIKYDPTIDAQGNINYGSNIALDIMSVNAT